MLIKIQNCDQCDFNTASKAMLRVHKRTMHRKTENKKQDIEVDITPSATNDSTNYENKENNVKTAKKYVRKRIHCNQCDKKFNKESKFTTHMKTVHESNKRVECNQCDKHFNNQNAFREHMKTEDQAKDVGLNKEITLNNSSEQIKSNEMTFHYQLRNRGVPEKQ